MTEPNQETGQAEAAGKRWSLKFNKYAYGTLTAASGLLAVFNLASGNVLTAAQLGLLALGAGGVYAANGKANKEPQATARFTALLCASLMPSILEPVVQRQDVTIGTVFAVAVAGAIGAIGVQQARKYFRLKAEADSKPPMNGPGGMS